MSNIKKGEMRLYPSYKPALKAGKYRVQMEQSLKGEAAFETLEKYFEVTGPQLSLSSREILGAFPPNNAVGAYDNRLPHITLKRRTLPWERIAKEGDKGTPWLALIVLSEAECNYTKNVSAAEFTGGLSQELKNKFKIPDSAIMDILEVPKPVIEQVFPLQSEVAKLAHVREVNLQDTELANGDDDGFMSVLISNRLPRKNRSYGAYLISIEHRLDQLPTTSTPTNDIGDPSPIDAIDFDLIKAASKTVARSIDLNTKDRSKAIHSISTKTIENARSSFSNTLPTGFNGSNNIELNSINRSSIGSVSNVSRTSNGASVVTTWGAVRSGVFQEQIAEQQRRPVAAAPSKPFLYHDMDFSVFASDASLSVLAAYAETIKFPVLAHWSFTCTKDGGFETLMRNVDIGLHGKTGRQHRQNDAALFTNTIIPTILVTGHTLIDHLTRQGEETQAWYRGPLSPREIHRNTENRPYHMADQARRLVESSREDISDAAAFECGRLLALSDVRFVQLLADWRKRNFFVKRQKVNLTAWKKTLGINILDGENLNAIQRLYQVDVLRGIADDKQLFAADAVIPIHEALNHIEAKNSQTIADGLGLSVKEVEKVLTEPAEQAEISLDTVRAGVNNDFNKITSNAEVEFSHLQDGLGQSLQHIVEGIGLQALDTSFDLEEEIGVLLDGMTDLEHFMPDNSGTVVTPSGTGPIVSDVITNHIDTLVTDIRTDLDTVITQPLQPIELHISPTLITPFIPIR